MRFVITLLAAVVCSSSLAGAAALPYSYPYNNPIEATVFGLPAGLETPLSADVPTEELRLQIFPGRTIPGVFWYQRGLVCSLAAHDGPAPLLFLITGTGARYDAPTAVKLQKVFFDAGFHVLTITSPTHMDFVVNAAADLPGDALGDARDLLRVLRLAYDQIRSRIAVTEVALSGYSLGAFQAAYIAQLDAAVPNFHFSRVLLINPPVDLYTAVAHFDALLVNNVPGGISRLDAWFRDLLIRVLGATRNVGTAELSPDSLFALFQRLPATSQELAAVVGLAFRLNAANMIFTADVMRGGGYLVPTQARFTATTSLTRYAIVALRTPFTDYFDELLLPHLQQEHPGVTRQALLEQLTLRPLTGFLEATPTIGLVHNADDIILGPGDLAYLERTFGSRARIFPSGGHLGNLFHPAVVQAMTGFLTGQGL